MGFEKFEKNSFGQTATANVTLRQSGSIGLSSVTVEDHFDDVDGVVLYFDEDNNRIGFEPANTENDPDAYKLSKSQGSGSVAAESFMKRYNLIPEETISFDPEWDDDQDLLVVDLGNGNNDE